MRGTKTRTRKRPITSAASFADASIVCPLDIGTAPPVAPRPVRGSARHTRPASGGAGRRRRLGPGRQAGLRQRLRGFGGEPRVAKTRTATAPIGRPRGSTRRRGSAGFLDARRPSGTATCEGIAEKRIRGVIRRAG